jgi:uncharacterized caspase-like protein
MTMNDDDWEEAEVLVDGVPLDVRLAELGGADAALLDAIRQLAETTSKDVAVLTARLDAIRDLIDRRREGGRKRGEAKTAEKEEWQAVALQVGREISAINPTLTQDDLAHRTLKDERMAAVAHPEHKTVAAFYGACRRDGRLSPRKS